MEQFSDIIGHDFIIASLKKIIASGKLSHAYVFDGMEGVGKKLLAGILAKTLQCQRGATEPCNECISCRAFGDGNHPDVIYVKPEKGKALGVDDIREQINNQVRIKPYQYQYKIFILNDADKMTAQAQNALLKTIEEPPTYAVFLLISTNIKLFLPTIVSRCVIYKLKPVNNTLVQNYLKDHGYDHEEAAAAAILSEGSIGKALQLMEDENFKQDRADVQKALERLPDLNLWDILLLAKNFEKYKDNPDRMLNMMYLWYRDALVYKATGDQDALLQTDRFLNIADFCRRMNLKKISDGMASIVEARRFLASNGNYLLTMEVMLMGMIGV